jgi:hypothetical protein
VKPACRYNLKKALKLRERRACGLITELVRAECTFCLMQKVYDHSISRLLSAKLSFNLIPPVARGPDYKESACSKARA